MVIRLGALYLDRPLEAVRRSWGRRLDRLGHGRLELQVEMRPGGVVQVHVAARTGRRLPHRQFGALVREALGPEREERAEMWLLDAAEADPGALRLADADWSDCLRAIAAPGVRQVRLWSPLVCPGGMRKDVGSLGSEYGVEMRAAECWAVAAVPRPKVELEYPPPWKGNYGW
ncbi:MAG TPA: hypothetical protein VGC54_12290 [Planctomycetota bacterium]